MCYLLNNVEGHKVDRRVSAVSWLGRLIHKIVEMTYPDQSFLSGILLVEMTYPDQSFLSKSEPATSLKVADEHIGIMDDSFG